jgi:hypothetical protein
MNFSPNNAQLANNQQFGRSFDVKNIFRPYPLSISPAETHIFTFQSTLGIIGEFKECTAYLGKGLDFG